MVLSGGRGRSSWGQSGEMGLRTMAAEIIPFTLSERAVLCKGPAGRFAVLSGRRGRGSWGQGGEMGLRTMAAEIIFFTFSERAGFVRARRGDLRHYPVLGVRSSEPEWRNEAPDNGCPLRIHLKRLLFRKGLAGRFAVLSRSKGGAVLGTRAAKWSSGQ